MTGSDVELVAHTAAGAYRGSRQGGLSVWKGMRYAAPPVGENRFRRARPVASHRGVIDADDFGAVCPQRRHPVIGFSPDPVMDEDCLFLNVWSPAEAKADVRPVMVWVPGGAYVYGAGSQPLYDGARLAADGGIVVVTINYRVGAFGFADLTTVDELAESNAALSDVLAALEWVRDNIAEFGGDPTQVTLAGESAGGGLVTTMLTVPAARGLFHQAIAQSSPATTVFGADRTADVAQRLVGAVGGTNGLRAASTEQLVEATMAVFADVPHDNPGVIAFSPVVDGDLVAEHPLDAFRAGRSLPVPLLIGTNRDEAAAFRFMGSPLMPIDPEQIQRMFDTMAAEQPGVVLPDATQLAQAYPRMRPKQRGLAIARDLAFRMPSLWVADAHLVRAPLYLYRFDWAPPMYRALRIGATHGTELPYMFGNLDAGGSRDVTFRLGGRTTGEAVSTRMRARWAAYVRTGRPDSDDVVDWPRYRAQDRRSLLISKRDAVVTDLDADITRVWGDQVLAFR